MCVAMLVLQLQHQVTGTSPIPWTVGLSSQAQRMEILHLGLIMCASMRMVGRHGSRGKMLRSYNGQSTISTAPCGSIEPVVRVRRIKYRYSFSITSSSITKPRPFYRQDHT